jgi:hypothetical protein
MGVSSSGLKYCLNTLIDKGWVKVHNFSRSKNKFGCIYVVPPQVLGAFKADGHVDLGAMSCAPRWWPTTWPKQGRLRC